MVLTQLHINKPVSRRSVALGAGAAIEAVLRPEGMGRRYDWEQANIQLPISSDFSSFDSYKLHLHYEQS